MEIRIIQMGSDPTVRLAAEELKKYLPMVDPSATCFPQKTVGGNQYASGIGTGDNTFTARNFNFNRVV